MSDELADLDATAQAELVRRGTASPTELVEAAIERIERIDPRLNAVIHPSFDEALADAAAPGDGPFRGVPYLMKDLWSGAEAGRPCHLGVRAMREAGYRSDHDSNMTVACRSAGFVICGRTNTPELGLVATTEPSVYGPTRNPWDPDRGTGGSSGGAAAAVASGMVPVANASDGGGSIRIPAALCGLVGLKPSRGRVSMGPVADEWGNSVQHALTRTVRDSAAVLDATARPFPGDGVVAPDHGRPYVERVGRPARALRIGVIDASLRGDVELHAAIATHVTAVGHLLEQMGHHVERDHPPVLDDDTLVAEFSTLWMVGAAASIDRLTRVIGRQLGPDDVEPSTWALAEIGRSLSGPETLRMQAAQTGFRRALARWWTEGNDILLTATTLQPAPLLGEMAGDGRDPTQVLFGSIPFAFHTAPFNVSGQPAISVPAGMVGSTPIGVQLVAAYGREDHLFELAGQLEQELAWTRHRPEVHALSAPSAAPGDQR